MIIISIRGGFNLLIKSIKRDKLNNNPTEIVKFDKFAEQCLGDFDKWVLKF